MEVVHGIFFRQIASVSQVLEQVVTLLVDIRRDVMGDLAGCVAEAYFLIVGSGADPNWAAVVVDLFGFPKPHVMPLALLLCMIVTLEWRREPSAEGQAAGPTKVSWWRGGLALVILCMFSWSTIDWLMPLLVKRAQPAFRHLARKLDEHGIAGPFACESRNRGILMAYHSRDKYAGFPSTLDVSVADQMIRDAGIKYILIFDNVKDEEVPVLSPQLIERPGWNFVFATKFALVYRLGGPPTTQPTRPIKITTRPSRSVGELADDMDDEIQQAPRPKNRKGPRK